MIYRQREKNSPYYWDGNWCDTRERWLEKDPEAEFEDLDGDRANLSRKSDNLHSLNRYNTIFNTSGAVQKQPQNVTKCDKTVTSWGNYSIEFDQVLQDAGTPQDKRLVAEAIGLKASSNTFRQILGRRIESGQVRYYRNSPYLIEWIKRDYRETNIGKIDKPKMLDIKFPLGIHDLACLSPRSVTGMAGVTGGAKTAFLLELAELNVFSQPMPVYYWYNEMGEEMFDIRCEDFPLLVEAKAEGKFHPVMQTDFEFGDVLVPDAFNIVDYVDRNEEFYKVGADIQQLYAPLSTGIVVFGLQKNPNSRYGYGGIQSAKLSGLYITLDIIGGEGKSIIGKATIVKAKYWKDFTVNPRDLECQYKTGGKWGKIFKNNEWKR